MVIPKPIHEPEQEEYQRDLQEVLDFPIALLVDQAVTVGWKPQQVFLALMEVARIQAIAYEEDLGPAGD